jgi:hypothetical protein
MVGQAKLSQSGQKLDLKEIRFSTIFLYINPERGHVCWIKCYNIAIEL